MLVDVIGIDSTPPPPPPPPPPHYTLIDKHHYNHHHPMHSPLTSLRVPPQHRPRALPPQRPLRRARSDLHPLHPVTAGVVAWHVVRGVGAEAAGGMDGVRCVAWLGGDVGGDEVWQS